MIIVYGGTFNPPTIAHQIIANQIIEIFKPSKFLLLPVGDHYTWKDLHVSFNDRFNMLKLAFDKPIFDISTLENDNTYKGTYYTLNQIKKTYKSDVYFLLGADNLSYLDQWINYQALLKDFNFIVLKRKGFDLDEIIEKYQPYENKFHIVEMNLAVSSSLFRADPLKYAEFIPTVVLEYIKNHQLYEV